MRKKLVIWLVSAFLIALCGCGTKTTEEFTVTVSDSDGNALSDISVQFCDDQMCRVVKTDENGLANLGETEGSYSVHIIRVPDGYAADDTEYELNEENRAISVVLDKE